jgi:hypothetical protein
MWLWAAACGGDAARGGPGSPDASSGSSDGGPQAPDAASGGSDSGGQLTLTATSARFRTRVGFNRPASGRSLIDVGLTLSNVGEARPLPVTNTSFLVGTADKLLYPESFSDGLGLACPGLVEIESGGALTCHVTFQVPATATVTHFAYSDSMARSTTAAIASVGPALPVCAYWQSPLPSSCRSCALNTTGCPFLSVIFSGPCATENAMGCLPTDVSADPCVQVKPGCTLSAACATELAGYQDCIYNACISSCPETDF